MPRKQEPANEPGETTQVVSDPDGDPGPGDNPADGRLPTEPDYTGPGTYAPRSERLDWPDDSVCYLGAFGAYEISAEQWKQAGVEDQPGVRWDASNQYAIPRSSFTETALRVFGTMPMDFKVT